MRSSDVQQESIKIIIDLRRRGKIFIPSPIRLLRVTNVKRCENPGYVQKVHHISSDFGLCFCSSCSKQPCQLIRWNPENVTLWSEAVNEPRCAMKNFYFDKRLFPKWREEWSSDYSTDCQ